MLSEQRPVIVEPPALLNNRNRSAFQRFIGAKALDVYVFHGTWREDGVGKQLGNLLGAKPLRHPPAGLVADLGTGESVEKRKCGVIAAKARTASGRVAFLVAPAKDKTYARCVAGKGATLPQPRPLE